jgi:hypothetical protein
MSPTVTFQDGLELVPLEDPKDKAARPDAPTGRGLTSFLRSPSARGDTLAPVAPIKADVSTVFPHVSTSDIIPSSRATLEVSTHTVLLKDEGVGGSGRATDRQKFRAPKVRFLLKNRRIPSSETRGNKL